MTQDNKIGLGPQTHCRFFGQHYLIFSWLKKKKVIKCESPEIKHEVGKWKSPVISGVRNITTLQLLD